LWGAGTSEDLLADRLRLVEREDLGMGVQNLFDEGRATAGMAS